MPWNGVAGERARGAPLHDGVAVVLGDVLDLEVDVREGAQQLVEEAPHAATPRKTPIATKSSTTSGWSSAAMASRSRRLMASKIAVATSDGVTCLQVHQLPPDRDRRWCDRPRGPPMATFHREARDAQGSRSVRTSPRSEVGGPVHVAAGGQVAALHGAHLVRRRGSPGRPGRRPRSRRRLPSGPGRAAPGGRAPRRTSPGRACRARRGPTAASSRRTTSSPTSGRSTRRHQRRDHVGRRTATTARPGRRAARHPSPSPSRPPRPRPPRRPRSSRPRRAASAPPRPRRPAPR